MSIHDLDIPMPTVDDRFPMANIDAELSCLGSCFLDNDIIDTVAETVTPADFWRDAHQEIFREILVMHEKGIPVNGITFHAHMTRLGRFETVGGDRTLEQICLKVPYGIDGPLYATMIRERSISRQLVQASTDTLKEAYSGQVDGADLLCSAEERVFAISQNLSLGEVITADDLLAESIQRLQIRKGGEFLGIPLGFRDIDAILMGAQPGQFIILAARPSIGKTSLVVNMADRVSNQGNKVLFFSLEMNRNEIGDRLLSSNAMVEGDALKRPKQLLSREAELRVYETVKLLAGRHIRIDDSPTRNTSQIGAIARRMKRKEGLDLLILDHMGKIEEPRGRNEQGHEVLGRISNRMKQIARQLHIPVVALHHINRESEKAIDGRPKLHMLKGSGNLEQDADVILILHRPEFYNPQDSPGEAELEIAKNRNGATGMIKLRFQKEFTRFDSIALPSQQRCEQSRRPGEQPF